MSSNEVLSHDEQIAILDAAIAEFAKHGWHVWKRDEPNFNPYEVALRRKTGLFAREFMALWVEDDGQIATNYVGEGGRIGIVPVVMFDGD